MAGNDGGERDGAASGVQHAHAAVRGVVHNQEVATAGGILAKVVDLDDMWIAQASEDLRLLEEFIHYVLHELRVQEFDGDLRFIAACRSQRNKMMLTLLWIGRCSLNRWQRHRQ